MRGSVTEQQLRCECGNVDVLIHTDNERETLYECPRCGRWNRTAKVVKRPVALESNKNFWVEN